MSEEGSYVQGVEFVEYLLEEGRRPEWFVTSPPYRNALAFLKNACRIAKKVGVAFKLRLNFLEPVNSRAQADAKPPCYNSSDRSDPRHVQGPAVGGG